MFGQEPLIDENTPEGSYFKETFIMLWNQGKSAKEIAEELQFFDGPDNPNSLSPVNPYDNKLKLYHVYYYAQKWGLPKRRKIKKKVKYHLGMPPAYAQQLREQGLLEE